MALLLPLSAPSDEVDISMISVTYGNVPRTHCARNVLTLFNVLEKELAWRRQAGKPEGYHVLQTSLPIVALGAEHPLEGEDLAADYFCGEDGLQNVYKAYPHFSPAKDWPKLFEDAGDVAVETVDATAGFTPSKHPAHHEMLRFLRENPENSIIIVAMGPFTGLRPYLAQHGFNHVISTHPIIKPSQVSSHPSAQSYFEQQIKPHVEAGSHLALWTSFFIMATFDQITSLQVTEKEPELSLHDPLTIWYAMTRDQGVWESTAKPEDLRVETTGEWTRGMHVVDKRNRKIADDGSTPTGVSSEAADNILGDDMGWLNPNKGNRINRLVKSPGVDVFREHWIQRVFG
ncbi:unnamed protein product [Clonostachys rhizophaga]|uniref:Inosine/uridine-preferring nucleoside hydrolase domain-containing protein n=1 Tax=Clonostachys rhizophaga TaxID=160324 RepID=A0A9N9YQQ3_9HYPO|nr:unnamed protein product [Clonostachys rhizophaga]